MGGLPRRLKPPMEQPMPEPGMVLLTPMDRARYGPYAYLVWRPQVMKSSAFRKLWVNVL